MASHSQPVSTIIDEGVLDRARALVAEIYADEANYPASPISAQLVQLNLDHVDRVRSNAAAIAEGENLDAPLLELAAVLHDVAKLDHRDSASGGIDTWHHHHRGASLARKLILTHLPQLIDAADAISQMIERHSDIPFISTYWTSRYHTSLPSPRTEEDIALRDADVIDMLWVGGMAKIVCFRQMPGCEFYLEDGGDIQKAIASAHTSFREALACLVTPTSKRLAGVRTQTVLCFFESVSRVQTLTEFSRIYDRFVIEKKSEQATP
jgi:hypothetical protein